MIQVFPIFDPLYHTYYLEGLAQISGRQAVTFRATGFPTFDRTGLAFIVERTGSRVYIDTDDSAHYDERGRAWCDVYAKVNAAVDAAEPKLLPIGPGFAVRANWLLSVLPECVETVVAMRSGELGLLTVLRRWWWMLSRRLQLSAYSPSGPGNSQYVFFASSVWAPDDACNQVRAWFMEAAEKQPRIRFEGGFTPPHRDDVQEYVRYQINRRYSIQGYLQRLRRSAVAFNTPAVLDCHGWRLAEYFALGKAVLSTPLRRALPAPLEHGVHLHLVPSEPQAIAAGLDVLCADAGYRIALGCNARKYFERYLAPAAVMRCVLAAAGLRVGG